MTRIADLHAEWLKDPSYETAYDALEDEYARLAAGLVAREARSDLLFQIYKDAAGKYRWRLVGQGGEVLALSDDYKTSGDARRAIEELRRGLAEAQVIEIAA